MASTYENHPYLYTLGPSLQHISPSKGYENEVDHFLTYYDGIRSETQYKDQRTL